MSSIAKTGLTLMLFIFACSAASPISHAQSGPLANVMQLNVSGAYLGIQMDDVSAANMSQFKLASEKGVIVRSVGKGTPAERAGLREEDVILEFAGIQVWSAAQFSRLVQETPIGRKVEMVVSRDGKRINLVAEVGKRDSGRMGENLQDLFRGLPDRPNERREIVIAPSGQTSKPRLGLTLQPLGDQLAQHMGVPGKKGVLVASVLEGSLAAGKVQAGDVIIALDGREVREPEELSRIVRDKAEGTLTLKIIRDKKEITVSPTLPALPSGEGRGLKL